MCAALHNAAGLHHQDLIRAADGRQPVRDHERRAALHQVPQAFLNQRLGFGIQARGRLVQNQNARIGQNRARNRNPLPLPAGEFHAALADDGVVLFLEMLGELIHARDAAGLQDSSSVASGRANATFSRIVPSNRNVSCSTTPSCVR